MPKDDKYKIYFTDYLSFLLKSPLATWWGVATAIVGFVGFSTLTMENLFQSKPQHIDPGKSAD
ncbi:MAG: hypothetical protein C4522_16435 [Desulfobacteraceae bacterium]|nr:MAG: hypothetical protein C4522_16435 [Desulfobacteraceae bacterium]